VTALNALLDPAFARRTSADLSARLRAARLMHQRVNTYLEFLDDPQVKATGAVTWIEQPGIGRVPVPHVPGLPPLRSGTPRAVAPSLDQHRKEILAELGEAPAVENPPSVLERLGRQKRDAQARWSLPSTGLAYTPRDPNPMLPVWASRRGGRFFDPWWPALPKPT